MSDLNTPPENILHAFGEAGQAHVFGWWDELSSAGRERLLAQLQTVDLNRVASFAEDVRADRLGTHLTGEIALPEYIPLCDDSEEDEDRRKARLDGETLLRVGKVAVLTVAGGQGTRLGYDGPKGTYPIGPVSGKSLFRIQAERILATARRYGATLPWYVMTSEATDAPTRAYFEDENYLGLPPEDVYFFTQKMLPALDHDFRLVMTARDKILMSPNGHGGTLLALADSGALDDMEARGIVHISYYQVDNPLVDFTDPVFLGFHHLARAQMSSKTILKREPEEPIGAFVRVGGKLAVIEYSDLTPEQMREKTADGALVYGLGSPAMHVIDVDFVRDETRDGLKLPFHLARKSAACLNENGELIKPKDKNVYKFETFIFDALQDTERSVILETRREREFSPVKNATGKDSAETCRRDMSRFFAKWLETAGVNVPRDAEGQPRHPIEISPLYALDRAELAEKLPAGFDASGPVYLGPDANA